MIFSALHSGYQAASNEEAEKYERAFIFQLLASDSSSGGKEVRLFLLTTLILADHLAYS